MVPEKDATTSLVIADFNAKMMHMNPKTVFYYLLTNNLVATITNMFVWFTLTFWLFLETQSVLATSYIAGIFAIFNMISAFFFGSLVDRNRKKTAMLYSSLISLVFYSLAGALYLYEESSTFTDPSSVMLWIFIVLLMLGSVAGNLRTIALATTVSLLFTEGKDKANGMIGAVNGVGFSITSLLSGLAIGFFGMGVAICMAIVGTVATLLHLFWVPLVEKQIVPPSTEEAKPGWTDLRSTVTAILAVPGLLGLIFFTTFNNFLGGVFMSLMDAYGLSLVSVQTWGTMFAALSFGFIIGSTIIARYGLGQNPLRSLLLTNVMAWTTCIFFTIQPSVFLLGAGMLIWMSLVPFIEAAEHTVIQSVVPLERQGRVFGFAQSIESAAAPITTFLIGPIAAFVTIPFMTTGAGVELIGDWFGTGPARGIALVFSLAGAVGLSVTLLAFWSRSYRSLQTKLAQAVI